MEDIRVTKDNLDQEHICCAISNNKDVQVASKKAWLAARFDDGLVFLKSAERGKCFIEYIPAENAWNPIDADGYMYIDCHPGQPGKGQAWPVHPVLRKEKAVSCRSEVSRAQGLFGL